MGSGGRTILYVCSISVDRCVAKGGHAVGGAIYMYIGNATVTATRFTNCNSTDNGGALGIHSHELYFSGLALSASTFENCSAVEARYSFVRDTPRILHSFLSTSGAGRFTLSDTTKANQASLS